MDIIKLELNKEEFPQIIRIYGKQAARIAMMMCLEQKIPVTETNCYSVLMNLESDLQSDLLL